MAKAHIGRHPIFDRNKSIYGYEMLFRGSETDTEAHVVNGDHATSQVLNNLFFEIGVDQIVGDAYAFVNLTNYFLESMDHLPFTSKKIVLEILETVEVDDTLVQVVESLHKEGFIIAIDDYVPGVMTERLFDYADIVKVDLPSFNNDDLARVVADLRKKGDFKLLAEKVESQEDYKLCYDLGFDYFQGYFFCKPNIVSGHVIPHNKMSVLRLLKAMQNPDISIDEIESLIAQNVTFGYKILRYVNSASFSLSSRVDSIRRAIAYVGLNKIRQWLVIMSVSSLSEKPESLVLMELALIRSNFMVALGSFIEGVSNLQCETVGLFSILEALMEKPMGELLLELPFCEEIQNALLLKTGALGELLQFVLSYEADNETTIAEVNAELCAEIYLKCVTEAKKTLLQLVS